MSFSKVIGLPRCLKFFYVTATRVATCASKIVTPIFMYENLSSCQNIRERVSPETVVNAGIFGAAYDHSGQRSGAPNGQFDATKMRNPTYRLLQTPQVSFLRLGTPQKRYAGLVNLYPDVLLIGFQVMRCSRFA